MNDILINMFFCSGLNTRRMNIFPEESCSKDAKYVDTCVEILKFLELNYSPGTIFKMLIKK